MRKFYDLLLSDRTRVIRESKDPQCIYDLLEKHLLRSSEELKLIYSIKLDLIMNRISISSEDYTAIYDLFIYLNRFNLTYESITQFDLRIDLDVFINKIL